MRDYSDLREEAEGAVEYHDTYITVCASTIVALLDELDALRAKPKRKAVKHDDSLFPGIDPQVAADFKAMRTKQRASITPTAMAGIQREADKAGMTLEQALIVCCERNWRGFKAEWIEPVRGRGGQPQLGKAGQATARAAQDWMDGP